MSIVLAVCLGLLLVPAVVGVSAGAGDPPEPASGKAAFRMPAEVEVLPGETFLVNVTIYNPHSVYMTWAALVIGWDDAALLSLNDVTDGDWPLYPAGLMWPQPWNTATDNFTMQAGQLTPGTYQTTTITHCTINFTAANTDGVTTVRFVQDAGPYGDMYTYILDPSGEVQDWSSFRNMTVKIGAPKLTVNPSSLSFSGNVGGANPPNQMLEVCHSGAGTLDWSLTDGDTAWLSESSTSGSLDEGVCEDVTVSVDVTGMEAGDYSATIAITGSAAVEVPVSLHIESAIPVGPAQLSASALSIMPQQVEPGEEVTISINVANTGGETGSYNGILYINGVVEDSQTVSVAPGTSKNVIFTVSKSEAGVYDVSVAGESGQFEVVSGGWSGGGLGTGGIIAIVVVVIALIVVLALIMRRTRRPE